MQAEASRSLNKHRKIASSFRDTQLFEIFQLSCSLLRTAVGNLKSMNFTDDSQVRVFLYLNVTFYTAFKVEISKLNNVPSLKYI